METFTLPVGTFHGISFREVHPLGHPAFRAVSQRGRFYKFATNPEFPAVDAEPAVLEGFLLFRETLDSAPGRR